jgi:nucleoside-diphosphate-sugar epimerase
VFGRSCRRAASYRCGSSPAWIEGKMPGSPRIGLEIVDVRDLADVHVRAMISPKAAGQRFLATGECTWMRELARSLRDGLGAKGAKVSARELPDVVVRLTSIFDKSLRSITVSLDVGTVTALRRRNGCSARRAARRADRAAVRQQPPRLEDQLTAGARPTVDTRLDSAELRACPLVSLAASTPTMNPHRKISVTTSRMVSRLSRRGGSRR